MKTNTINPIKYCKCERPACCGFGPYRCMICGKTTKMTVSPEKQGTRIGYKGILKEQAIVRYP